MRIYKLQTLVLFPVLLLLAGCAAASDKGTNQPVRITAELRDGSRVIGQGTEEFFRFHSALFGNLKLPAKDIRLIDCVATNEAKLTTAHGDVLTVELADSRFALTTSFGEVTLPVAGVRRLTMSGSRAGGHAPGLVAFWSGEDGGKDSAGHNDLVPTDLTYAGGPAGRAFALNGFSSCLELADTSGVNVGAGGGLTLSVWIKPEDVSGFHPIIEWNPSDSLFPGTIGVQLWIGNSPRAHGVVKASIVGTDSQAHDLISLPGMVVPGRWQQLVVTYDKATGLGLVYLDGVVVVNQQLGPIEPLTQGPVWISDRPTDHPGDWTYQRYFKGLLNDIAIYNRALTAEEIRAEKASSQPD